MKKTKNLIIAICSLIVVFAVVITVVVIKTPSFTNQEQNYDYTSNTQATTEITMEQTTQPTTQYKTVPIEWEEVKYTYVDNDGYEFEISLLLSPWILLSNQDAINSAWERVGGDNILPQFDDWGLEKQATNNIYKRDGLNKVLGGDSRFQSSITDMYYCMASLKIKNVTEGWNIDYSSPRAVNFDLCWNLDSWPMNCIGKVFYSDVERDYMSGAGIIPNMVRNDWGPLSIVFMAPENMSPNNPDGDVYSNLLFYNHLSPFTIRGSMKKTIWNGNEVNPSVPYVGVIGKDGEYAKPNQEERESKGNLEIF